MTPYWLPIAIIGPTAAKVQPCIIGSRTPKRQKPTDWMMLAIPATKRSALIRNGRSPGVSLPAAIIAPPTTSGTATAPAYMARTCCRPSGASRESGGTRSTGWTSLDDSSARRAVAVTAENYERRVADRAAPGCESVKPAGGGHQTVGSERQVAIRRCAIELGPGQPDGAGLELGGELLAGEPARPGDLVGVDAHRGRRRRARRSPSSATGGRTRAGCRSSGSGRA